VVCVLLLVLIGFFAYRAQSRKNESVEISSFTLGDGKEILSDGRIAPVFGRAELNGNNGLREMSAEPTRLAELPGDVYNPQYPRGVRKLQEK
jgi:hypothetical protein